MTAARAPVFLSYASQDAAAAGRIFAALREARIEAWFDQGELTGGEAWDASIREQIRTCSLFLPIISSATQARREGYFRREWKMAAERTHDMADGTPFLVPIVIDGTTDPEALVPQEFRAVQWTFMPGGEVPPAFASLVLKLLDRKADPEWGTYRPAGATGPRPVRARLVAAACAAACLSALALWLTLRFGSHAAGSAAPDSNSVAVLAFADLSPERDAGYFSDGISEELINSLAKIPGLKVCARTSSFFFKGKDVPLSSIAQALGVSYLIEGSVLKIGTRVRITAELVKAADGYSEAVGPFEREVQDLFSVQNEIAASIAKSLSLRLGVAPDAAPINPKAVELYLAGRHSWNRRTPAGYDEAEPLFVRALDIEPNFARADAALADVWLLREETALVIGRYDQRSSTAMERVLKKIREAVAMDPDSSEAHASLGVANWMRWNFPEAERELRVALALNPNNAYAHHALGRVLLSDGWIDESISELGIASTLDPLSARILDNEAWALCWAGRYSEALRASARAVVLQSDSGQALTVNAFALVKLGRVKEALAEVKPLLNRNDTSSDDPIRILARAGAPSDPATLLPRVEQGAMGTAKIAGYLCLGRREDALASIDAQSLLVWDWASTFFDPLFDQIRQDPRYLRAVDQVGSGEAYARAQAWRAAHPPQPAP